MERTRVPRKSRRQDCQGDDAIDQFQDSASRERAEAPRPSGMATYHRSEEAVHEFPIEEVTQLDIDQIVTEHARNKCSNERFNSACIDGVKFALPTK